MVPDMKTQLREDQQEVVQLLVDSGRFVNAEHVVSEALNHLEQYERYRGELRQQSWLMREPERHNELRWYKERARLREGIVQDPRIEWQDGTAVAVEREEFDLFAALREEVLARQQRKEESHPSSKSSASFP